MPPSFFPQTVIAVVWDFDKTLIPGYMQEPLFRRFGVEGFAADGKSGFWDEVRGLAAFYKKRGLEIVSTDALYLGHILTYVREGRFPGLTNRMLREMGAELAFYDGVPAIFESLKARPSALGLAGPPHNITVEHYVVSTGLRQMVLGSAIAPYLEGVWACEFVEAVAPPGYLSSEPAVEGDQPIAQVGYSIDNTTKTRAIFEINKGVNVNPQIDVNSRMAPEDRRVPMQNMVYVADGPSDVPVFSVVHGSGGRTYAVYQPGSDADFDQARLLLEDGRVHAFGEANYSEGTQSAMWLRHSVDEMAKRIARERNDALAVVLGKPPQHIA